MSLDTRSDLAPSVSVLDPDGDVVAVALVLPGGRASSFDPGDPAQLAWKRMEPFAKLLHRRGRTRGLAVWNMRYRFRGWNGAQASPVEDVRWALDEVRRRHGDVPVVLIGHSMGGRTALRVADDVSVVGVCALAPWIEKNDPVDQLVGRAVLIAHGTLDVVTSAPASRRYAARAAEVTAPVGRVLIVGDVHAMLFRWRTWHRLAAGFALGTLGFSDVPRRISTAYRAGKKGRFALPV